MRLAPLLIAGGVASLVAGCGSTNVDTAGLERQLRQQVVRADAKLDPGDVKVTCPREEEAKVGNTFTCTLSYHGDERSLVVEIADGDRYTLRDKKR